MSLISLLKKRCTHSNFQFFAESVNRSFFMTTLQGNNYATFKKLHMMHIFKNIHREKYG